MNLKTKEIIKKTTTISFSELFHWVEKYDITWNQANNLFFRSEVLQYKSYDEWITGQGIESTGETFDEGRESWDLTREEIDSLDNYSKAQVLIDIFLKELDLEEALFLNN